MELAVPCDPVQPIESFISDGHRTLPVLLEPSADGPNGSIRLRQ
ncbi:hypothetical protein [Streptomyces sp. 8N616]